MNTAITITLIVCGTAVAIICLGIIASAIAAKKAQKTFNEISKNFIQEDK